MAIGNLTLVNADGTQGTAGSGAYLARRDFWEITGGTVTWWAVLCGSGHTPSVSADLSYQDLTNVLAGDGAPVQIAGRTHAENGTALEFTSDEISWGTNVTITFNFCTEGTCYFIWDVGGILAAGDNMVLGYVTGLLGASGSEFTLKVPVGGWFQIG